MTYAFERDAMLNAEERDAEIDRWYENNSEPAGYQLADRMFWRYARHYAEAPDTFGELIHEHWIGQAVTLEQAAQLALPLMDQVFNEDRQGFGEWVTRWFIDPGLDRQTARKIVEDGRETGEKEAV